MGRKSRLKSLRRDRKRALSEQYRVSNQPRYTPYPLISAGLTEAERDLTQLCRTTFLSLWSYANVHYAQYSQGGIRSREVCDVLVVFGNHVVIFSDKDCIFPSSGSVELDWARWFRRAVKKSANQLHGAERVIRSGEALFSDPDLQHPLPVKLPDPEVMICHRVLVAHGVTERCKQLLGGSGTLMIRPEIVGEEHLRPIAQGGQPFAVGRVDSDKRYVHVLDDAALVLLLRTLDTAADFIGYLEKKEALIASGRLKYAAGEEALLGWYLRELNDAGEHDFIGGGHHLAVDERWWHDFATSPQAANKASADAVSYLWDRIIESFARHFREGTSDHQSDVDGAAHVSLMHFFARENRIRRRILSKEVVDMLETTKPHLRRLRVVPPSRPGDPYWVLLLLPFQLGMDYRKYREARYGYMSACLKVTKLMNPDAMDIVGFATETGRKVEGSEDAAYFDARTWTKEDEAEARRLQVEMEILVSPKELLRTEYEYPA